MYPKDTEKWKQFTTKKLKSSKDFLLFCIPKILKNESNSQPLNTTIGLTKCCFVSQRYWKMKAIHNNGLRLKLKCPVVLYPKDTEKWKQFTTKTYNFKNWKKLFCIPKILKNESNSQHPGEEIQDFFSCFVSQRYWKMKAIHNENIKHHSNKLVVLYPKDTEKWKQFTTTSNYINVIIMLFCIPKILKNESNSQLLTATNKFFPGCFVSQRYWKMKAIHNRKSHRKWKGIVVLYPKDTEKWKQFTTPI